MNPIHELKRYKAALFGVVLHKQGDYVTVESASAIVRRKCDEIAHLKEDLNEKERLLGKQRIEIAKLKQKTNFQATRNISLLGEISRLRKEGAAISLGFVFTFLIMFYFMVKGFPCL